MISIQIGASVAKQLFPVIGVTETTALRLCLAAIMLSLVHHPWKGKLNRKDLISVFLYGISLGFMNLFFYLSLERIPLGVVVPLEFIGPLIITVYNSKYKSDFIWISLAVLGVALFLPVIETTEQLDLIGILFALGGGLCWAVYIVFGKRAGTSLDSGKTTALGMGIGALVVLPFSLFSSGLDALTLEILPLSLIVAIFSSALPYSFEMIALKKIPPHIFGVLLSIEPVFAAFFGFFFLNECLSWLQIFAIILIIVACFGAALPKDDKSTLRTE